MELRAADKAYAVGQTALLVVYTALYLFDREPLLFASRAARVFGLALCVAGLLVMACAFVALRSVIQIAPHPRAGGRLITAGIYAYLRHPIYTAIVAIVVGLFLRKPTAAVAAAGAVVAVFLALKTRFEEQLLATSYADYPAYKRRTFGLFPIARG